MAKSEEVRETTFSGRIRAMFDDIAPTYDLLNRVNSFGLDQLWRKDLVAHVAEERPEFILDLAAGTGDLSLLLAERCKGATVVASDLSMNMLEIGLEKAIRRGLEQVKISVEDAMDLSFEAEHFDVVTCAFGVRNFESIARGYQEIYRVLRPGGMVAVLELCVPTHPITRAGYNLHVDQVIPWIGQLFGQHRAAYQYLGESIRKVPQRRQMEGLMQMAGFVNTYYKVYTPGVCALYVGFKPESSVFAELYNRLSKIKNAGRLG